MFVTIQFKISNFNVAYYKIWVFKVIKAFGLVFCFTRLCEMVPNHKERCFEISGQLNSTRTEGR